METEIKRLNEITNSRYNMINKILYSGKFNLRTDQQYHKKERELNKKERYEMKKTIQEYKAEHTLDIRVKYEDGIMTRREFIKKKYCEGARVEISERPKIYFSRIKFNRLCGNEQTEYEKKCNTKIPCYNLYLKDGGFYEITKAEFDLFNSIELEFDINTQRAELSEKIDAGIATEAEINEDMQKESEFFNKYFNNLNK